MIITKSEPFTKEEIDLKILIESLAVDLYRVAVGLNRGSKAMAERFKEEALKEQKELQSQKVNPYLKTLLSRSQKILKRADKDKTEDVLMYSILLQNFARKYYSYFF